jgi:hypothetical protein
MTDVGLLLRPGSSVVCSCIERFALRMLTRKITLASLVLSVAFVATPAAAKKLVITEAIEITGKIQRPEAMFIFRRTQMNLEGLRLKQSLIPRLRETMKKPPL